MSDTERIKDVGRRTGGLVVGVAAASAFNEFVPEGHRPEDILLGAQSVIVAGSKGPTAGAWDPDGTSGGELGETSDGTTSGAGSEGGDPSGDDDPTGDDPTTVVGLPMRLLRPLLAELRIEPQLSAST